jgi:hypothetical protein
MARAIVVVLEVGVWVCASEDSVQNVTTNGDHTKRNCHFGILIFINISFLRARKQNAFSPELLRQVSSA